MKSTPMRFTEYLTSKGYPVIGVSILVDPPIDPANQVRIDFTDSATQDQINAANAEITNYDWATLPPVVDFNSFKGSINLDSNISVLAKVELFKYFPILGEYLDQPDVVKSAWYEIKQAYGSGWLDSQTQTAIEGYAKNFNIPLV